MDPSIRIKVETILDRHYELNRLLATDLASKSPKEFATLSKEFTELSNVVETYNALKAVETSIEDNKTLLEEESDPEFQNLIKQDLKQLEQEQGSLLDKIYVELIPKDPNDKSNVFLEIRAGTGGLEAAIFAGDLFRMYHKFAENNNWKLSVISASEGDQGGYKEIISLIEGTNVYHCLKFESGGHRVQRIPETESGGRIHTSACTVAVMPEVDQVDSVEIDPSDLRIDTFRASGAGGQHVNKTDSAVRIVHNPTGLVVECQDDRSQHKNKAKAMSLLKSKLLQQIADEQQKEQTSKRKLLVGSGDRSERIRTYNYPQGRITDHRINLTLYKLPDILEGDLKLLTEPLQVEQQAKELTELSKN